MRIIWPNKRRVSKNKDDVLRNIVFYERELRLTNAVLPLFLNSNGVIISRPTIYLYDKHKYSKLENPFQTVRTYAESLLIWLKFCNEMGWSSEQITPDRVLKFRNNMRASRIKSLAIATVNLRLTVLLDYWKFLDKSCVESMRHLAFDGRSSRYLLRDSVRKPTTIPMHARKKLKENLTSGNKLLYQWTIATGMRVGSALSITVSDFEKFSKSGGGFLNVYGKGGKSLQVYVPTNIVQATHTYINFERKLRVERRSRGLALTGKLFVNSLGQDLNRTAYYKAFKKALGEFSSNYSPHDTRSTFATHVKARLDSSTNLANLDGVKIIQGLLGHADYKTTEIYIERLVASGTDVTDLLEQMVHDESQ